MGEEERVRGELMEVMHSVFPRSKVLTCKTCERRPCKGGLHQHAAIMHTGRAWHAEKENRQSTQSSRLPGC